MSAPSQAELAARKRILAVRTVPVTVRVVDSTGKALPSAVVHVKEIRSAFRFGCAVPSMPPRAQQSPALRPIADRLRAAFARLFNYATTENACKWAQYEPSEGVYNDANVLGVIEFCKLAGAELKGHNLIWGADSGRFVPSWLLQKPDSDVRRLFKAHIFQEVSRFKSDIHLWDVVNESLHCHWFASHYGPDYVLDALNFAHQADPSAYLLINEYANFHPGGAERYAAQARDLLARGAPLNALGIQAHDPPYWYSPDQLQHVLDTLAATGLDLHLTEFTFPSDGREILGGYRSGTWTEEAQAEFYRYFFTLCFAHPAVKAITLWALWDGASWLKKGGLLRKDFSEKPAYRVLDTLINHTWRTEGDFSCSKEGKVTFRAFKGEYSIEVSAPGHTVVTLHQSVSQPTTFTVSL